MADYIIGVDLGGTQMRVARYDTSLTLVERVAEKTLAAEGREPVILRLLDVIARVIRPDDTIVGIGVSAPGPVNPYTGTILWAPNLPGWEKVPLRKIIQERFGITTYLGNDANVAALAEAVYGAGRGYAHVIYLTVSTGIGSGIIEDKRLVLGAQGLAAEAGHMIMVGGERISTLEKEASGTAIARKARTRIEAGEPSAILALVDGDPSRITAEVVGRAAADGDRLAVETIRQAGYMVGLGIVTLMHLFNPQIVVVGGGVTHSGELLFEPMRQAVREHTLHPDYCEQVPIVAAALGDDVALIGAATLVATRGGNYH